KAGDPVVSHYERILAVNPSIEGHRFNDAVTGAQMGDAPRQAGQAVAQGAEYVTILMGANDLCTDTIAQMTPTDVFRSEFEQTMQTLGGRAPTRRSRLRQQHPEHLRAVVDPAHERRG